MNGDALNKTKAHFLALDSWRGICALLVAAHHFFLFSENNFNTRLMHSFFLFVDFFFVLSGFVIALNYSDKIKSKKDLASYVIRRFGRVWPLHAVVMTAFLIFYLIIRAHGDSNPYTIGASPTTYDYRKFPLVLMLLNSLGMFSGGWNLPSWSISAEFISYLLFGFAFILPKKILTPLIAVIVAASFLLILLVSQEHILITANFGFIRGSYGFGTGILAFYFYREVVNRGSDIPNGSAVEIVAIFLLIAFLLVSVTANGDATAWSLASPLVFGTAVLLFANGTGFVSNILRKKIPTYLGKISYSIYINHWLILVFLAFLSNTATHQTSYSAVSMWGGSYWLWSLSNVSIFWLWFAIFIGSVIVVSHITYKYVEDLFRRKFNKIANNLPIK